MPRIELDHLPATVAEFVAQEPKSKIAEYQTALSEYQGRLSGVVAAIDPVEVVQFQDFTQRKINPDVKKEELDRITQALRQRDYARDISQVSAAEIFLLSKYNDLGGLTLDRLPIEEAAQALWEKHHILLAFNHPLRTKVRDLYEQDLQKRYPGDTPYEPLPPMNSPAVEYFERRGELTAFEEYTAEIPIGPKVSRQLALAIGPYSVVGRHHVGIPVGSETMPDVVGSPVALADLVMSHALAAAPRNNIFSDPKVQAQLIYDTQTILDESPVLEGRPDRDLILSQWDKNLGILVEPNPYKACKRIETVLKNMKPGRKIGYVRIYMVEGADEMMETAEIIHNYFPDLEIDVGQVINEEQDDNSGNSAASFGIGITSGSRCSTAARAGVAPQNMNLLYRMRKQGVQVPIYSETGVPHHAFPVGLASGLSRVNYSAGALGWMSAVGGVYGLKDGRGRMLHIYDGEAGPKAKGAEGRIYAWERVVMPEGVNGTHIYDSEDPTAPHRMWYLTESVVLTDTFHRYLFLEDMHYDSRVEIKHMSEPLASTVRPFDHF